MTTTALIATAAALPAKASRHQQRFAGLISASVFMLFLAGRFGFERVGLENPLPIPERAAGALALLLLLGPPAVAERRNLAPVGRIPGQRAVMLLLVVLLGSVLWGRPSPGLADAVWDLVMVVVALALLSFALRLSREAVVSTFAAAALVAGTVYAVAGLAAPAARVAAFGGGPNVYARITGLGIIAGVFIASREGGRRRGYVIALIPVMAAATVLSGSRGAMAGTLAGLIVMALTLRWRAWRRILVWSVAASPLVYLLYARYGPAVEEAIQVRIVRLTLQERYTSGRTPLLEAAVDMFQDRPFVGWGLHGFEALHGWSTGTSYPHNLVLQLAAETGLLGLSVLSGITVLTVLSVRRGRWREATVTAPLASAVLVLVASQFSGDYYDARFAWAFLLIALSAHRLRLPLPAEATPRRSRPAAPQQVTPSTIIVS